jgi:flavin reductase (DIM6/NTAB) family NADH-FMN oxidoreductase RutF
MDTAAAFHALTARIDYPMFIVTVAAEGERAGCLVGFTTQCSIDPPRYLVCLSRQNRTFRVAAAAGILAVHLLGAGQRSLAELFGTETGDETDKFLRCDWQPGPAGVPILDGVPAWFVGRVIDRFELGDHFGVVLEVVEASADGVEPDGAAAPLTFQHVRDLEPGHPA